MAPQMSPNQPVRHYQVSCLIHSLNSTIELELTCTFPATATQNDLWAHIEACASIVTVCLPTLAPLFRDSRLGNCIIKSVKRVHSASNTTISSIGKSLRSSHRAPSRNELNAGQTWVELESIPRSERSRWASAPKQWRRGGGGNRGEGRARDWVV